MATATQKDTFDQIMLSGATMYSWYQYNDPNDAAKAAHEGHFDDNDHTHIQGWEVTYSMEHPTEDGQVDAVINHDTIVRACRRIIGADRCKDLSESVVREARALLVDVDAADFDANTADEVLQIIAYDKIVFG